MVVVWCWLVCVRLLFFCVLVVFFFGFDVFWVGLCYLVFVFCVFSCGLFFLRFWCFLRRLFVMLDGEWLFCLS